MRVAHVISGLGDGGAEAVLYRLCSNDPADRHLVISLTGEGKYGAPLRRAGIEVRALGMDRRRLNAAALVELGRALRTARPDVVQTWMYHADLLGGAVARLCGIPTVCWGVHNTDLTPGRSRRSTIAVARACAMLSTLVPAAIVCCGERAAEAQAAIGHDRERMTVIPNGYDLVRFRPDPLARRGIRQELNVPEDAFVIGSVARFDPQKDHRTLIAALARLAAEGRDFLCLLAGTGMSEENAELARWIAGSGLSRRVRLLGQRDDIPALMNALDIHVTSSRAEAFPNVICEAMASGTPCVSTDVGDARTIIGETGWIVPPGAPAALFEAMERAIHARSDAVGWTRRAEAARSRIARRYSIERMVERYRAVWAQARRRNSGKGARRCSSRDAQSA